MLHDFRTCLLFLRNFQQTQVFHFSIVTQEESSLYGDILQEGFVDSYANLSVKSLMLAKWFTQVGKHYMVTHHVGPNLPLTKVAIAF